MSFFEIQNLKKSFGRVVVADDISFKIEKGEFVGIIGPNGAGKTTLFHMITGIVKPNSGEIIFKGEKITGLPTHKIVQKGLSRTFQIPRPFKELTVMENIEVANAKKDPSSSLEERAERVLKQVGLWDQRDQLAGTCPRVTCVVWKWPGPWRLHQSSSCWTSPLPVSTQRKCKGCCSCVWSCIGTGLTILIVEHKLKELMQMVQRVIAIDFGKLIADDIPQRIVQNERVLKAYMGDRRWNLA